MLNVLYFCLALSFCILQIRSQSDEYTWEDYDGTIPEKAFSASDDPNNPIYVGMALVGNNNCTGTLLPGATEITVECNGVHTVKEGLKVLTVKDPTRFQWLKITNQHEFWAKVKKVGKPVKSGHDAKKNLQWSVGRTTTDNGTLEVGHIAKGIIHFAHENSHRRKTKNYEVLVLIKGPRPPSKTNQHNTYTWENYNGNVPENALSVSDDVENPVYVGMGMVDGNNCTGTLLPQATELTVYCTTGWSLRIDKVKDNIKILTVTDKTKFKWIKMKYRSGYEDNQWKDQVDGEDLVVSNLDKKQGIYWYVGRYKTADGSVKAGQMINGQLRYVHKDQARTQVTGQEFLALAKGEEGNNETEKIKTAQTQEPVEVVSEDSPSQPDENILQTKISVSDPSQPNADSNVGLNCQTVEATINAHPDPKAPAAFNSGQPTVNANAGLNVDANVDVQDTPNVPSTFPKAPSGPKASFAPAPNAQANVKVDTFG